MREKIVFVSLLFFSAVMLSGCVKKTEAPTETDLLLPPTNKKDAQLPNSPAIQEEALPKATGKIDDLVDAVLKEADSEKNTLADEERTASDAAADVEEINNLEKSYDENEL